MVQAFPGVRRSLAATVGVATGDVRSIASTRTLLPRPAGAPHLRLRTRHDVRLAAAAHHPAAFTCHSTASRAEQGRPFTRPRRRPAAPLPLHCLPCFKPSRWSTCPSRRARPPHATHRQCPRAAGATPRVVRVDRLLGRRQRAPLQAGCTLRRGTARHTRAPHAARGRAAPHARGLPRTAHRRRPADTRPSPPRPGRRRQGRAPTREHTRRRSDARKKHTAPAPQ